MDNSRSTEDKSKDQPSAEYYKDKDADEILQILARRIIELKKESIRMFPGTRKPEQDSAREIYEIKKVIATETKSGKDISSHISFLAMKALSEIGFKSSAKVAPLISYYIDALKRGNKIQELQNEMDNAKRPI